MSINTMELKAKALKFIGDVEQKEIDNAAAIKSRMSLEKAINDIIENNKASKEALDIASHAIELLRKISDDAVSQAYSFLQDSLNESLKKMFVGTTRKIEIREYTRGGQYPQLELVLHVGNGRVRSLKTDSGHGLAQIVSLLSILSLIVITGSRRILVMDEVLSGLSVHNRQIVSDILWTFTQIGFQFIVNDHGFVIKGSKVYHLEMVGDVSGVKQSYIASRGVYLQSDGETTYDYSDRGANVDSNEIPVEPSEKIEITDTSDVANIVEGGTVISI